MVGTGAPGPSWAGSIRTGGVALKVLTTVALISLAGPFHHVVRHHHHSSSGHSSSISTSYQGLELAVESLEAAAKLLDALPCKSQVGKSFAAFKEKLEGLKEEPSRDGIKASVDEGSTLMADVLRACVGDKAQPFTQKLQDANNELQEAGRLKDQEALLQDPLKEVGTAIGKSAEGAQQVFWNLAKSAGEFQRGGARPAVDAGAPPSGTPRTGGCPDMGASDGGTSDGGSPDGGPCARAR